MTDSGDYDLSKLTDAELGQLERLLMKARRAPPADEEGGEMNDALVSELLASAKDAGLYFAGWPDHAVRIALIHTHGNLKRQLVPTCGVEMADLASEAYCAAALRIAKAIESATQGIAGHS